MMMTVWEAILERNEDDGVKVLGNEAKTKKKTREAYHEINVCTLGVGW
jgi:hypothetical protein